MKKMNLAHGLGFLVLAACATQPLQSTIPATLVPPRERAVERISATGVQIYQCRAATGGANAGPSWVFVAPEANLFDAKGRGAGTHYAGPHWEAPDGSKIVGALKAKEDAPKAGSIPWLLLSARSVGSEGRFASITSVQRVNTEGGVAPARKCDASTLGVTERVPYTADYVLLSARTHTAM